MYNLYVLEDKNIGPFLQLSKDLLEKMNWKEGDNIEWIDNKDGTFTLKKYER